MGVTSRWRLFYLFHFSQPAHDRALYQAIHRRQFRAILELGIGTGRRALRMIEVAQRRYPESQVCYTGVDEFEARCGDDGPAVPLKSAYQMLRRTGARVRLLPGDPLAAISRAANNMAKVDLLVISSSVNRESLGRAWLYVPRLLDNASLVVYEQLQRTGKGAGFRVLSARHVGELAQRGAGRRAA